MSYPPIEEKLMQRLTDEAKRVQKECHLTSDQTTETRKRTAATRALAQQARDYPVGMSDFLSDILDHASRDDLVNLRVHTTNQAGEHTHLDISNYFQKIGGIHGTYQLRKPVEQGYSGAAEMCTDTIDWLQIPRNILAIPTTSMQFLIKGFEHAMREASYKLNARAYRGNGIKQSHPDYLKRARVLIVSDSQGGRCTPGYLTSDTFMICLPGARMAQLIYAAVYLCEFAKNLQRCVIWGGANDYTLLHLRQITDPESRNTLISHRVGQLVARVAAIIENHPILPMIAWCLPTATRSTNGLHQRELTDYTDALYTAIGIARRPFETFYVKELVTVRHDGIHPMPYAIPYLLLLIQEWMGQTILVSNSAAVSVLQLHMVCHYSALCVAPNRDREKVYSLTPGHSTGRRTVDTNLENLISVGADCLSNRLSMPLAPSQIGPKPSSTRMFEATQSASFHRYNEYMALPTNKTPKWPSVSMEHSVMEGIGGPTCTLDTRGGQNELIRNMKLTIKVMWSLPEVLFENFFKTKLGDMHSAQTSKFCPTTTKELFGKEYAKWYTTEAQKKRMNELRVMDLWIMYTTFGGLAMSKGIKGFRKLFRLRDRTVKGGNATKKDKKKKQEGDDVATQVEVMDLDEVSSDEEEEEESDTTQTPVDVINVTTNSIPQKPTMTELTNITLFAGSTKGMENILKVIYYDLDKQEYRENRTICLNIRTQVLTCIRFDEKHNGGRMPFSEVMVQTRLAPFHAALLLDRQQQMALWGHLGSIFTTPTSEWISRQGHLIHMGAWAADQTDRALQDPFANIPRYRDAQPVTWSQDTKSGSFIQDQHNPMLMDWRASTLRMDSTTVTVAEQIELVKKGGKGAFKPTDEDLQMKRSVWLGNMTTGAVRDHQWPEVNEETGRKRKGEDQKQSEPKKGTGTPEVVEPIVTIDEPIAIPSGTTTPEKIQFQKGPEQQAEEIKSQLHKHRVIEEFHRALDRTTFLYQELSQLTLPGSVEKYLTDTIDVRTRYEKAAMFRIAKAACLNLIGGDLARAVVTILGLPPVKLNVVTEKTRPEEVEIVPTAQAVIHHPALAMRLSIPDQSADTFEQLDFVFRTDVMWKEIENGVGLDEQQKCIICLMWAYQVFCNYCNKYMCLACDSTHHQFCHEHVRQLVCNGKQIAQTLNTTSVDEDIQNVPLAARCQHCKNAEPRKHCGSPECTALNLNDLCKLCYLKIHSAAKRHKHPWMTFRDYVRTNVRMETESRNEGYGPVRWNNNEGQVMRSSHADIPRQMGRITVASPAFFAVWQEVGTDDIMFPPVVPSQQGKTVYTTVPGDTTTEIITDNHITNEQRRVVFAHWNVDADKDEDTIHVTQQMPLLDRAILAQALHRDIAENEGTTPGEATIRPAMVDTPEVIKRRMKIAAMEAMRSKLRKAIPVFGQIDLRTVKTGICALDFLYAMKCQITRHIIKDGLATENELKTTVPRLERPKIVFKRREIPTPGADQVLKRREERMEVDVDPETPETSTNKPRTASVKIKKLDFGIIPESYRAYYNDEQRITEAKDQLEDFMIQEILEEDEGDEEERKREMTMRVVMVTRNDMMEAPMKVTIGDSWAAHTTKRFRWYCAICNQSLFMNHEEKRVSTGGGYCERCVKSNPIKSQGEIRADQEVLILAKNPLHSYYMSREINNQSSRNSLFAYDVNFMAQQITTESWRKILRLEDGTTIKNTKTHRYLCFTLWDAHQAPLFRTDDKHVQWRENWNVYSAATGVSLTTRNEYATFVAAAVVSNAQNQIIRPYSTIYRMMDDYIPREVTPEAAVKMYQLLITDDVRGFQEWTRDYNRICGLFTERMRKKEFGMNRTVDESLNPKDVFHAINKPNFHTVMSSLSVFSRPAPFEGEPEINRVTLSQGNRHINPPEEGPTNQPMCTGRFCEVMRSKEEVNDGQTPAIVQIDTNVWIVWDLYHTLVHMGEWPNSKETVIYDLKSQLAMMYIAANPTSYRTDENITLEDIIKTLENCKGIGSRDLVKTWNECIWKPIMCATQPRPQEVSLELESSMLRDLMRVQWTFREKWATQFDQLARLDMTGVAYMDLLRSNTRPSSALNKTQALAKNPAHANMLIPNCDEADLVFTGIMHRHEKCAYNCVHAQQNVNAPVIITEEPPAGPSADETPGKSAKKRGRDE